MTTFAYTNPTVGGSEDTWGTTLNANWTALGNFIGTLDSAELAVLDGITATTAELNHVDGVTSPIQTQLDAKAANTAASIATSINLTGAASTWSFALSGNNLVIKYGGVGKAKLDTSGNLTVTGNVTAYGSV
jgi:hypothetical protein